MSLSSFSNSFTTQTKTFSHLPYTLLKYFPLFENVKFLKYRTQKMIQSLFFFLIEVIANIEAHVGRYKVRNIVEL